LRESIAPTPTTRVIGFARQRDTHLARFLRNFFAFAAGRFAIDIDAEAIGREKRHRRLRVPFVDRFDPFFSLMNFGRLLRLRINLLRSGR
jgi:hypothetical protein